MTKDDFRIGDRARFRATHDKTMRLEGKIVRIHEGTDDCVDLQVEPDGKILEVPTVLTAHAGDVELLPQPAAVAAKPAPAQAVPPAPPAPPAKVKAAAAMPPKD